MCRNNITPLWQGHVANHLGPKFKIDPKLFMKATGVVEVLCAIMLTLGRAPRRFAGTILYFLDCVSKVL
jgi:uncharacterized membrane protein YphA (DoxX/SURF4 family)